MTSLVYGIVRSATAGWSDPFTVTALSIGSLLLAFFILNEWRAEQPIMPLRLFASRERAGAYAAHRCNLFGNRARVLLVCNHEDQDFCTLVDAWISRC